MRTTAVNLRDSALCRVYSLREWVHLLLDLAKIKISLLATFSATTGYLLATGRITIRMLVPTSAVFLLACGACALNQYQERGIDQRMERTKSRPLPSGRLNSETALRFSLALILSGLFVLLCGAGNLALALGLFAVLWYNLIYTPLKRKTAFAAVPGALVGAIPPVLGWVAGGAEILDPRIGGVALFFFLWQIPHFWILLLDASKDYEIAGLPSVTRLFSTRQIKRIVFIWLLSTGAATLTFPFLGLIHFRLVYLFLILVTSWFIWNAILFFTSFPRTSAPRNAFWNLNAYALVVLLFLSVDRFVFAVWS